MSTRGEDDEPLVVTKPLTDSFGIMNSPLNRYIGRKVLSGMRDLHDCLVYFVD
jgi:hypothetical protein